MAVKLLDTVYHCWVSYMYTSIWDITAITYACISLYFGKWLKVHSVYAPLRHIYATLVPLCSKLFSSLYFNAQ
jgi:hypothetical protein